MALSKLYLLELLAGAWTQFETFKNFNRNASETRVEVTIQT